MRSAQPHLNAEELGAALIVMPPDVEQALIEDHVLTASEEIDAALETAKSEIILLREYRTRLIADVVTGKLDVRDAAVSLPEEPGDLEQGDELEDTMADASEVETRENDSEADGDQR